MKTKLIEATQRKADGFNWGKFLIGDFDTEWQERSALYPEVPFSLLGQCGWTIRHILVTDMQTGEGAIFLPGGHASYDLNKHKIWVCPMFEPFLEWLYTQDVSDISKLPSIVELRNAPEAMAGYRRSGEGK